MGFDLTAWLSAKLLGTTGQQTGVSGYGKPKGATVSEIDRIDRTHEAAGQRRGDTDDEYDTYGEDRNLELE